MENKNTFQRILWTIAGAEIPILEKCRTDHKKYGAMGADVYKRQDSNRFVKGIRLAIFKCV